MHSVITNPDQITAEWLTSVLTRSGALTRGAVESFTLGAGQGNWSTSANLSLGYSSGAQGAMPQRLFLKMANTDLGDGEFFSDSEVTYYTRDYVDAKHVPLLRCYDAEYSPEANRYHILLDDVSDTHIEAAEKEPTLAYGLALAEGLAAMHAHWWGQGRLSEAGAPIHDAKHIRTFVDMAAPGVEHIVSKFSAELKPHWPDLMRDLFAHLPQLAIRRGQSLNGFTLIHGDAGCSNILVPRNGDCPIYIIDRQPFNWSLTTWLGVYDLAYAVILDWDVELRRQHETTLLEQYHRSLVENGVRDYSLQQLWDDYKLCAAICVSIPVEYCRGGVNERWTHVWMPMLQRALTACDDLDCAALWRDG